MAFESFMDQLNKVTEPEQNNILENYTELRKAILLDQNLSDTDKADTINTLQQTVFGISEYYKEQCNLGIRRHDQEQDRSLGLDHEDIRRWKEEQESINFDDAKSARSLVQTMEKLNDIGKDYDISIMQLEYKQKFNGKYMEYAISDHSDKEIKNFVDSMNDHTQERSRDGQIR